MIKRRILVFNGYYTPAVNYGGPTTSLKTVVRHCCDEFDFYIISSNHDLNEKNIFPNIHDGWNEVDNAMVLYLDLNQINYKTNKIRSIFSEVKPDLVWIIGILHPAAKWNVSYLCRKLNIPFLISPRGEVCINTIHLKYIKKKIVISIANFFHVYKGAFFHATSIEEESGIIRYFHAPKNRVFLVSNISSSLSPKRHVIIKKPGMLKIVFISRIQEKKNLLTAIKAVLLMKDNVEFDIYGPIESNEYWTICQDYILQAPYNIIINYKGILSPNEVSLKFESYHCFLFPTISENYGHVIVESLSVSCPVILSRGTTPWDDLHSKGGFICDLHDIPQYTQYLNYISCMNQIDYDNLMDTTFNYFKFKILNDNAVKKHVNMFNSCIK